MLQQVNQTEARDLEWSCQAVSPMDEPCDSAETFHCGLCGRWFCAVHSHVMRPGIPAHWSRPTKVERDSHANRSPLGFNPRPPPY